MYASNRIWSNFNGCSHVWTDGYTCLLTITLVRIPHFAKMPHLEEFFTHGDGATFCAGSHAPEDAKPSARQSEGLCDSGVLYLHGPRDAGQTSLLLQFGFSQAQAGRNVVLVMCGSAGRRSSRRRLRSCRSRPAPTAKCRCRPGRTTASGAASTSSEAAIDYYLFYLGIRINYYDVALSLCVRYLHSSAELQHFLCSLHVVDKETSVLLVEGFERFFSDHRYTCDTAAKGSRIFTMVSLILHAYVNVAVDVAVIWGVCTRRWPI